MSGSPDRRQVRLRPADVGSVQLSLFDSDMQAVMRAAAAAGGVPRGGRRRCVTARPLAPRLSTTDPDGTMSRAHPEAVVKNLRLGGSRLDSVQFRTRA
jgi:hypothetical protein